MSHRPVHFSNQHYSQHNYPQRLEPYDSYPQRPVPYGSYPQRPVPFDSYPQRPESYDRIVEYTCVSVDCGVIAGITLQDYTSGRLTEEDIDYLVKINTNYRCPSCETTLTKSNVLTQWELPQGSLFATSADFGKELKMPILCPERGCNKTFPTKSDFKRHVAAILRPFYCLRGNCCIDGVPCRKGFGRIEEVINHLKNDNSQHHDPVRYRPVEGWDFRKKYPEEIEEVLQTINFIPYADLCRYYQS